MNFLKKLFFVTIIPVFVFGILFSFPQYSRSYDDKTTHPGLTDEIVDFYNFSSENKLTDEEKEWIVLGSINEDTEPRWINHFYDPINNEGWKAENLGWVPPLVLSVFSKTLLNINTETVSSKNWAHNETLQAKYGNYWGNRTWENAIRRYVAGDKMFAYQTLGDILHLLEDATVPDHTRNDTHVHEGTGFTTDGGSPYEDYAKDFTRATLHTANDLIQENRQPIILDSLDAYFDSLAKYSNGYFFSKDTINSKKYANPKILRESNGYTYGQDQYHNETILSEVRVETKGDLGTTKIYSLNNNLVLSSYFSRLSREAVLNGAGVIKLFFDEVAKEEKDKSLIQAEPKTGWWQEMRSPLYGFFIPTYNSVKDFVNQLSSANNSTNNNASVLLATTQNTQTPPPITPKQEVVNNTQSPQIQQNSASQPPSLQPPATKNITTLSPSIPTQTITDPTENTIIKSNTSSISYGGGVSPQPPQVQSQMETTTPIIITYINGVMPEAFASSTLTSATTTFSGIYNNNATFDKIIFELKNTSLNIATSSISRAIATTTGERLAYSEQITLESEGNWQYRAQLGDSVNASSTPWSALYFFNLATSTTATTTSGVASSSPTYAVISEQADHSTFDTTPSNVQGYGVQRNVTLSQPVTFTGVNNGDKGRIVLWYYFGYGQDCSTVGSVVLSTGPADGNFFSPVSATPNWDGSCVFRLANANGSVTRENTQPYALFLYSSFTHAGPYAYGKTGGNSNAVYCRGGGIYANSCTDLVEYVANLSDFAYLITSDTYTPPPIPSGTSSVPSTASPVAAEQADHSTVDATTQPNIYPIQQNIVLSHSVIFTGANVGDKGRIVTWYSFLSGQDCSNVGMVGLTTGPAGSTSFVPVSKTPSADGACVFHLGNANASVEKSAGTYALYMEPNAYSIGAPRPLGKMGGNSNAVFCAGGEIYASTCSDFRGYSSNLSDFAYIVTEDTYGMITPVIDNTPPVILSMSFSTSTGYAKIGDIITLAITADFAGYSLGATTINGVAVTGFTDMGAGTYTVTYTVNSGDNDKTSGTIPASVVLIDSAGNASAPFTSVDTNTLKLDANIPVLLSAQMTSTTTVDALFSEDLNGSTVTNNDFSITGHPLVLPDAYEISPGVVRLTVDTPFGIGESPEIFYNTTVSNGVKDLAGNVAVANSVIASSGVW
ncbi:MAG: hypothetical protein HY228_03105 [Candidatus Yonathbacteria bacterium]|nr:hypothetical protein [Candidatus Yonathbacteria bacterium]